jgi:DNA-binding HxlR family transcriptional regulator
MSDTYGQGCPIAAALDLIGDRWTLLILRDLSHGPMRFTDIEAINPKLSPNLLTKRLRSLQNAGVIRRRQLPPPGAVTVYEVDPRARELVLPVLSTLGCYGAQLFSGAPDSPVDEVLEQMRRAGHWVLAKGVDFEATYRLKLGPHDFGITVGPSTFEPAARPPKQPTATIESDPATLMRLSHAGLTVHEAETSHQLRISGDRHAAIALLERLSLAPLA